MADTTGQDEILKSMKPWAKTWLDSLTKDRIAPYKKLSLAEIDTLPEWIVYEFVRLEYAEDKLRDLGVNLDEVITDHFVRLEKANRPERLEPAMRHYLSTGVWNDPSKP